MDSTGRIERGDEFPDENSTRNLEEDSLQQAYGRDSGIRLGQSIGRHPQHSITSIIRSFIQNNLVSNTISYSNFRYVDSFTQGMI